jgi:hypothetical protein
MPSFQAPADTTWWSRRMLTDDMQLMNQALDQVGLPDDATQGLRAFFEEASTFMINARSRDSTPAFTSGHS